MNPTFYFLFFIGLVFSHLAPAEEKKEEGEESFAQWLLQTTDHGILLELVWQYFQERDDWEDMLLLLSQSVQLSSGIDDPGDQERTLREMISIHPERNTEWLIAFGEILLAKGRLEEAEALFWRVYESEPVEMFTSDMDSLLSRSGSDQNPILAELDLTRQSMESVPQILTELNPIFQSPRQRQQFSLGIGRGHRQALPLINATRSQALGYLTGLALIRGEDEAWVGQLNQYFHERRTPPHRVVWEKMKIGNYDEYFFAALDRMLDNPSDTDSQWFVIIGQTISASMRNLPDPQLLEEFELRMEALISHSRATQFEFYLLSRISDLRSQFFEGDLTVTEAEMMDLLQEAEERTEDDPHVLFLIEYSRFLTGVYFENHQLVQNQIPLILESAEAHGYDIVESLLIAYLNALAQRGEPLSSEQLDVIPSLLVNLGNTSFLHLPQRLPHLDAESLHAPIQHSDRLSQTLLNLLLYLYRNEKESGHPENFITTLTSEPEQATTEANQRARGILRFFIYLWAEDDKAISLGEELLANGDDLGVRLNLAFLYQAEGNLERSLALLEEAQMAGSKLFPLILWNMVRVASEDERFHEIGQRAVRRLAQGWDEHRWRIPDDLEDLYSSVGWQEEWKKENDDSMTDRSRRQTRQERDVPRWQLLLGELEKATHTDQQTALALELLRTAPLGMEDPRISGSRYTHYSTLRPIAQLRAAKIKALETLQENDQWTTYIHSLKDNYAENPRSLENIARIIEGLEMSESRRAAFYSREESFPEEVELRLVRSKDQITLNYRAPGAARWEHQGHLTRQHFPDFFNRRLKVGFFASNGGIAQPVQLEIIDLSLRDGEGREIELSSRFLNHHTNPLNQTESERMRIDTSPDGIDVLTTLGSRLNRTDIRQGAFLWGVLDNEGQFRATVRLIQEAPYVGHHGILILTNDDQIPQREFFSGTIHRHYIRSLVVTTTHYNLPYYYEAALRVDPNNSFFLKSYYRPLRLRQQWQTIIDLTAPQVEKNPYLVLRNDRSRISEAYVKSGEIPDLVTQFLNHDLFRLRLDRLGHPVGPLGNNLQEVAEYLSEGGFPDEVFRINHFAVDKLPPSNAGSAYLWLMRHGEQHGLDEADIQKFVSTYFAPSPTVSTSLLLSSPYSVFGRTTGDNGLIHQTSSTRIPTLGVPFLILNEAPRPAVEAIWSDWQERHQDSENLSMGALLNGSLISHRLEDPRFLTLFRQLVEARQKQSNWSSGHERRFSHTYLLPLLHSSLIQYADEEELAQIASAFRPVPRGSGFLSRIGPSVPTMEVSLWERFQTEILLGQEDEAWALAQELLEQMSHRDEIDEPYHALIPVLLRFSENRLEEEVFLNYLIQMQNRLWATQNRQILGNTLRCKEERIRLRKGEVRRPYIAEVNYTHLTHDTPGFAYTISSIHPEDTYFSGNRLSRLWYYGENFRALDGKFDLQMSFRKGWEDEVHRTEVIPAVDATGFIPFPEDEQESFVYLRLLDSESGDVVFEQIRKGFRFISGQPLLQIEPGALNQDEGTGLIWKSIPPREGPVSPFSGQPSLHFPGFPNDQGEVASTGIVPITNVQRMFVWAIVHATSTNPNPIGLVFYNDSGQEIERLSVSFGSSPERWAQIGRFYNRAIPTALRNRFPKEAAYARLAVKTNGPLSIAYLGWMIMEEETE